MGKDGWRRDRDRGRSRIFPPTLTEGGRGTWGHNASRPVAQGPSSTQPPHASVRTHAEHNSYDPKQHHDEPEVAFCCYLRRSSCRHICSRYAPGLRFRGVRVQRRIRRMGLEPLWSQLGPVLAARLLGRPLLQAIPYDMAAGWVNGNTPWRVPYIGLPGLPQNGSV